MKHLMDNFDLSRWRWWIVAVAGGAVALIALTLGAVVTADAVAAVASDAGSLIRSWLAAVVLAGTPLLAAAVPVGRPRRRGARHERGRFGAGQYGGRRRGWTGWARYEGRQRERSGFCTEREALTWSQEAYFDLRMEAQNRPTVSDDPLDRPIVDWLENVWLVNRPKVRRKKDGKLLGKDILDANRSFVRHFRAFFGDRSWRQFLTDSEAIDYLGSHHCDQASASKAFNDAKPNNLLAGRENPFVGKRIERQSRPLVKPLTPKELMAFLRLGLDVIDTEFKARMWMAMTEFAAWTGLRPSEIIGAQPGDILKQHGLMDVVAGNDGFDDPDNRPEPKWGGTGFIIASPRALRAIEGRPQNINSPWLFHYESGKQWGYRTYERWFKMVAREFGRGELTGLHGRHFAATIFHLCGWTDQRIAKQFRHKDDGKTVRSYYLHIYEGYELREMRRLIDDADCRIQHFIDHGLPWADGVDLTDLRKGFGDSEAA